MNSKPIILCENRFLDGALTASATGDGNVLNLIDYRTFSHWKGVDLTTVYIKVVGSVSKTANSLGISGHNFGSAGATVSLECSDDDFNVDTTVALAGFVPPNDKPIFKKFDQKSKRDWRLKLTGMTEIPEFTILHAGDYFIFPKFPHGSEFAPIEEEGVDEGVDSAEGHTIGVTISNIKITSSLSMKKVDPSWYEDTFKPLYDSHIRLYKPFFYAWDIINHPKDVYYMSMKRGSKHKAPFDPYRRSFKLDMVGVDLL